MIHLNDVHLRFLNTPEIGVKNAFSVLNKQQDFKKVALSFNYSDQTRKFDLSKFEKYSQILHKVSDLAIESIDNIRWDCASVMRFLKVCSNLENLTINFDETCQYNEQFEGSMKIIIKLELKCLKLNILETNNLMQERIVDFLNEISHMKSLQTLDLNFRYNSFKPRAIKDYTNVLIAISNMLKFLCLKNFRLDLCIPQNSSYPKSCLENLFQSLRYSYELETVTISLSKYWNQNVDDSIRFFNKTLGYFPKLHNYDIIL